MKKTPRKSLQNDLEYVRDKMTDTISKLESSDIAVDKAAVIVKASSVIVRAVIAEIMLTEG